jgi:hypothetical protein
LVQPLQECRVQRLGFGLVGGDAADALDGDTKNVAVPLRMVLSMERVVCQPL